MKSSEPAVTSFAKCLAETADSRADYALGVHGHTTTVLTVHFTVSASRPTDDAPAHARCCACWGVSPGREDDNVDSLGRILGFAIDLAAGNIRAPSLLGRRTARCSGDQPSRCSDAACEGGSSCGSQHAVSVTYN
eukprot:8065129-Pyramimonas_sp.AAC.1